MVTRGGFGSYAAWVHSVLDAMNYVVVDSVFHVARTVVMSVETARVGFILGEQQFRLTLTDQPAAAVLWFLDLDYVIARRAKDGALRTRAPRPRVPEPHGGQHVQLCRLRTPIRYGDLDQNIFRRAFRVFHEYVEVAVLVECSRVYQLKFTRTPPPVPVLLDELLVRKRGLGVFIQVLHIGVGRR